MKSRALQKEKSPLKYLVSGFDGPGFATPEEALQRLVNVVLPSLDALKRLEAEKRILAGGQALAKRVSFSSRKPIETKSWTPDAREIPFWGMLKWEVTPLESFESRAERKSG